MRGETVGWNQVSTASVESAPFQTGQLILPTATPSLHFRIQATSSVVTLDAQAIK